MNNDMRVKYAWLGLAVFCASAGVDRADTIVLKNGHRIVVLKATTSGDRVVGETPEGELSFSLSLVERIEQDLPPQSASAHKNDASSLEIAPPAEPSPNDAAASEAAALAVHDGRVDSPYLAQLDAAAGSGDLQAGLRAAAAHVAAALFEMQHSNPEAAARDERAALRFAPDNLNVLLNAAFLHLRQSEFTVAEGFLEQAAKLAPNSAEVAKLAGWADYGLGRIPEAVKQWQKSLALRDDPEVAQALEKAQRDAQTESNFREGDTNHFQLRYSGQEEPGLAREVLETLETHYDTIRDTLDYTPPEPIGVVLYTNQEFADITRAPSWVGALNDGRIRVPVEGLSSVNSELSRVLKHELTHSFVDQKTAGRSPVWLQEGIAQWMEGRRSQGAARALVASWEAGGAGDLSQMERSWISLSSHDASFAYAWSLAVVEAMIAGRGMNDLDRLLDTLKTEDSAEAALRRVYHLGYPELAQLTAEYLRAQYLR
jgi:tetratricopeptide (TPR) repeat protein